MLLDGDISNLDGELQDALEVQLPRQLHVQKLKLKLARLFSTPGRATVANLLW